jgi:RimJ/RimL family protein N-acetyltransferase
MAEAVRRVIEHGFDDLGLERIASEHYAHNPASGRVMQKAGMHCEGVRRAAYRKKDVQLDAVAYGLAREDYAGSEVG